MDHYEAEFNLIWDCSQIVEDIDYKDCCAFEDHFKFKLESFVRWICEDSKSDVAPPPKLEKDLKMLKEANFDLCSLEEIEIMFGQIYTLKYKYDVYEKVCRQIRDVFENLRHICCCFECWPDRKMFAWSEQKQYCFYKKKCLNPYNPIKLE